MLVYANRSLAVIDMKEKGGSASLLVANIKVAKPQQTSTDVSPAAIGARRAGHVGSAAVISGSIDESKWAARLVGAGSLLTLLYEVAYLGFDRGSLWISHAWPLFLHLLNIGLYLGAVIMTLRVGPWMRRHWKVVAFSFSTVLITSSMWLAIITGESEPLFVALMLFLAGTGPFLSWGERTQGLLSLVAIIAFTVAVTQLPNAQSDPYQWLGILIAAAIGLFSTALERRLHRARRRAEDEALESREILINQERIRVAGQLASGIAHDLNNTLNVIKLRLTALLRDDALLNRHEAALRTIESAVEDAALTVSRVRELGRNGEQKRAESSQLSEVIGEVIDLVRTTVEGKSSLEGIPIRIESYLPGLLPKVNGSSSELRQVFLNLLLNAYEAIHQSGEIIVNAFVRDNTVVVTVSDNGPGIIPEQLEQIFDPFFTTKGPRGTGLGLSIARHIMESVGGRITASNGSHGGAVFALEFPIASNSASNNRENGFSQLSRRRCFLLVDDDVKNLEALKEILLLQGHYADTAESGSEALEKIGSTSAYDIVLCDLAMPGMNGWEVARVALQTNPDLNFYIVTGWGEQVQSEIPPNLPVRGVLSKPIDLGKLERIATAVTKQSGFSCYGKHGMRTFGETATEPGCRDKRQVKEP
jgi:signal transduction histidine kinase/CheY-like chemotaxis protein